MFPHTDKEGKTSKEGARRFSSSSERAERSLRSSGEEEKDSVEGWHRQQTPKESHQRTFEIKEKEKIHEIENKENIFSYGIKKMQICLEKDRQTYISISISIHKNKN